MARVLTKCPECGHKISNRFECRNCGLLFNRYFEAQARKREAEKVRAAQRARTILIMNTALSAILVVGLLGGGFYLWSSKETEVPTPPSLSTPAQTSTPASQVATEPTTPRKTEPDSKGGSRPVDIALNAVAVITSPWGQSTGFFIAEDMLLTTKKTVLYDEERLAQETEQLRQDRIWLDEEPGKIEQLKKRYATEPDAEIRADLEQRIANREKRLEKRSQKYQESKELLDELSQNLKTATINIQTNDGRTFHMAYMNTSTTYDLALLNVFSTGITPAKTADRALEEGEQVYTLVINNQAIKSVFKGYSDDGMLLTDVPISQQYLGGPLVDEQGLVFGVSVTPPKGQRKAGLAVPVRTVMQEFGL